MKVLVLQSELGVLRGGGENFTRNLFTALAERGHRVSAAFVADREGKYPLPLPSSIDPIPIAGRWSRNFGQAAVSRVGQWFPFRHTLNSEWNRVQEAISWRLIRWHDLRFKRRVEFRFAGEWSNFDAVYVHGNIDLASQVSKVCPTVLRLPGPVTSDTERLLRTVQTVCANGDALLSIRKFLGDDVTELPIGIDPNLFKPGANSTRFTLNWTEDNFVVGYVGRLSHIKGIDLLATAFQIALQTNPKLRLLIIGSGAQEQRIRSYLSREIASRLVHLEKDVDHDRLSDWYRAMDLLVMPSRYENFSNAILEALACGIPFLATDVGGNRIVAESGAGWLFDPESVDSLVRQLQRLSRNSSALKTRGRVGRKYVETHHLWSRTAERLEQIMKHLIGEN